MRNKECYIMSIQDLEIFLSTYKNERGKFDRVVEVMLNKSSLKTEIHVYFNLSEPPQ